MWNFEGGSFRSQGAAQQNLNNSAPAGATVPQSSQASLHNPSAFSVAVNRQQDANHASQSTVSTRENTTMHMGPAASAPVNQRPNTPDGHYSNEATHPSPNHMPPTGLAETGRPNNIKTKDQMRSMWQQYHQQRQQYHQQRQQYQQQHEQYQQQHEQYQEQPQQPYQQRQYQPQQPRQQYRQPHQQQEQRMPPTAASTRAAVLLVPNGKFFKAVEVQKPPRLVQLAQPTPNAANLATEEMSESERSVPMQRQSGSVRNASQNQTIQNTMDSSLGAPSKPVDNGVGRAQNGHPPVAVQLKQSIQNASQEQTFPSEMDPLLKVAMKPTESVAGQRANGNVSRLDTTAPNHESIKAPGKRKATELDDGDSENDDYASTSNRPLQFLAKRRNSEKGERKRTAKGVKKADSAPAKRPKVALPTKKSKATTQSGGKKSRSASERPAVARTNREEVEVRAPPPRDNPITYLVRQLLGEIEVVGDEPFVVLGPNNIVDASQKIRQVVNKLVGIAVARDGNNARPMHGNIIDLTEVNIVSDRGESESVNEQLVNETKIREQAATITRLRTQLRRLRSEATDNSTDPTTTVAVGGLFERLDKGNIMIHKQRREIDALNKQAAKDATIISQQNAAILALADEATAAAAADEATAAATAATCLLQAEIQVQTDKVRQLEQALEQERRKSQSGLSAYMRAAQHALKVCRLQGATAEQNPPSPTA